MVFKMPHRLRLQGTASVDRAALLLSDFPGADVIVRVAVSEVFVNCSWYVQRGED